MMVTWMALNAYRDYEQIVSDRGLAYDPAKHKELVRKAVAMSALALSSLAPASGPSGLVSRPSLNVLVHLAGIGDRTFRDNEFAGTRGQGRRLEGFQLQFSPPVPGLSMHYMAHVQGIGDVPFVNDGQFVGTRGQSRSIEGFAIDLTGPLAAKYNVVYMAHLQGTGDTGFFQNGQFCGTRGQSRPVEGILVRVEPK